MRILDRIERLIFEAPFLRLTAILLALTLVKTGVWAIENLDKAQIVASNPFVDGITDPDARYLMTNWLGPFLAWRIGATSTTSLFLMHFAFSAAFTALFIGRARRRLPDEAARKSVLLFTVLPVSATAYFWVGYDSITLFLLMAALAVPEGLALAFFAGWALGLQHFEQGLAAACGLGLAAALSARGGEPTTYSWRHAAALGIGVLAGKATLTAIFIGYGVENVGSRLDWMRHRLGKIIAENFLHLQSVVFSVFGVGWLAALKFAEFKRDPSPFFRALLVMAALVLVSEDQTRVAAIISFPLVLNYWLFDPGFLNCIARREAAVVALVWGLTPWSWVWAGEPKWSAFPYDLVYFAHLFTGQAAPSPVWSFPPGGKP